MHNHVDKTGWRCAVCEVIVFGLDQVDEEQWLHVPLFLESFDLYWSEVPQLAIRHKHVCYFTWVDNPDLQRDKRKNVVPKVEIRFLNDKE